MMRQVLKKVRIDSAPSLPTASEYVEALNELQKAQEETDVLEALAIDQRIRAMVPPGLYAGYLDDVGLTVSTCLVQTIQRNGDSANLHAYYLELQEVRNEAPIGALRRMELVDFLKEVRRVGVAERQQVGRRFWAASHT